MDINNIFDFDNEFDTNNYNSDTFTNILQKNTLISYDGFFLTVILSYDYDNCGNYYYTVEPFFCTPVGEITYSTYSLYESQNFKDCLACYHQIVQTLKDNGLKYYINNEVE